ncbi:MAG: DUF1624 domain-containing protein [Clostridiales Family XIII bacterium]|jgi:uncharacterized membrane protein|nr:DUF1624 domain-containing protein [Clostridiales Family XIII bacterium]
MGKRGPKVGIQMERVRLKEDRRMALVDELRALAIISMIGYHFCYDVVIIFDVDWPWFFGETARLWQKTTSLTFIVIAGICTYYSTRPFIRAFKVGACALLVTGATYFVYPDEMITFGILHFLAASMLVWALFRRALSRIGPWVGFILSVLLAFATWDVGKGVIGLGAVAIRLPGFLYQSYWLSVLGFLNPDYVSADYFPFMPYFFVFMAGSYLSGAMRKLPPQFAREHIGPLAFIGRYSLPVYMTHQLVIFGALSLVFRLVKLAGV